MIRRSILAALALATVVSFSTLANAAIVNYSNVSGSGITITGISESTSDGIAHYGQPVLVGGKLTFPSLNFSTSATGTSSTDGSNQIVSTLNFTISVPTSLVPLFSLTEGGSFSGDHNAWATIAAGFVVTDVNGNPITVTPNTANIIPTLPFIATSNPTNFNWSATINPTSQVPVTNYVVHLNNDLFVFAPQTGSTDFSSHVTLTKNNLNICFTNCVPEPASLGVLGAGALALLGRRRKA